MQPTVPKNGTVGKRCKNGGNEMFNLEKNKKGIVKKLTFDKPLERLYIPHDWDVVHEELAKEYGKEPWNYLTVIVRTEQMDEKLWDDPRHAHRSYSTYCSEVEEEARDRARENLFSSKEIEKIFKKYKFPKERYNWEDEEEEENYREIPLDTEIKDAIYDAQVKMHYPAVIEEFKRECLYEEDEETGEEVKVSPKVFEKKWKERQLEIFLPRVDEEVDRALPNTPEPFDTSSYLTQFFFIEKNDKIEWASGSGDGSQTRYDFGLMGHLFATLTKKYQKTIPTYFFKNNAQNEFQYINSTKSH